MSENQKIHIIGIGDGGLETLAASARAVLEDAELLVGDHNTLGHVTDGNQERIVVEGNLAETADEIKAITDRRMVVIASGDPLFYGVARYLCDKIGKDRFEVLPHVSSMQLAFARVKESWDEAFLTNLANHSLDVVIDKVRIAEKVGLFTSEESTPNVIARTLLDKNIDYFRAYVCENLGSPDERVTRGELADVANQTFAPLNVMILVRKPELPDRPAEKVGQRLFGNRDDHFLQSKPKQGLLTPAEVRSTALAELDLGANSIVWDVGAGSGSVAIEAAQIASGGMTYAIEMDPDDYELVQSNAERMNVDNLVAVLGRAPDAWSELPDPDAIFIGGSGKEVSHLISQACERLKIGGRLVANVGSIENLAAVHEAMNKVGQDVNVWMMNIARGTYQLGRVRFDALNPTFLLSVVKQ